MKGRTPTKAESEWMQKARLVGCIACIKDKIIRPYEVSPEHTAIHHIDGKTKPDAHFLTLPLCPAHHQHSPIAVHVDKSGFERRYGKQRDLIRHVRRLIDEANH